MRRASPTATRPDNGKRGTRRDADGVAACAAVLGFGGLYAAAPLLAGEDVAPGTKAGGVSTGGMKGTRKWRT